MSDADLSPGEQDQLRRLYDKTARLARHLVADVGDRIQAAIASVESRLLLLDAIPARGERLFELARERDLESIVAKWSKRTYQCDGRATSWLKIKNPAYSQMENRREIFESRRH